MPCTDGGVPYPPSREEVLDRKAPAMLCAVLAAIDPMDLETVLKGADWAEAGVSFSEFSEWRALHRQRDERRRADEAARAEREAVKAEAMEKLTPRQKKALGL